MFSLIIKVVEVVLVTSLHEGFGYFSVGDLDLHFVSLERFLAIRTLGIIYWHKSHRSLYLLWLLQLFLLLLLLLLLLLRYDFLLTGLSYLGKNCCSVVKLLMPIVILIGKVPTTITYGSKGIISLLRILRLSSEFFFWD